MQDEESLVRRLQERDDEAWTGLYDEFFNRVYRYIRLRVGDRAEAEDLTEQVFLKALQSVSSYRWRGRPFSAWLFRIAHNQVVDHVRKTRHRRTVPLDESLPATSAADPVLLAEQRSILGQLAQSVGQLTGAQRAVIELRFAGELSTAETAQVLGKSPGAVKALQHSALVALRKILSRDRDG